MLNLSDNSKWQLNPGTNFIAFLISIWEKDQAQGGN